MKTARRLVIDIGTNSVLALLADLSADGMRTVFDKQKTTRLGEGLLQTGRLSEEAMHRTAEVIRSFMESAEFDSAVLVGTEALRVASNSALFIELVEQRTKHKPIVISGDREAEFTFRGAKLNLDLNSEEIVVVDVGGGSTEIIKGRDDRILAVESIPVGALRLRESVPSDSMSTYREYAADSIRIRHFLDSHSAGMRMIGVGGTITSLAALALGLEEYDPVKVRGLRMSVKELESAAAGFEGISDVERARLLPFDPQRADLILPGTGIFLAVMSIINVNEVIVSNGGLRFGVAASPEKIL